MLPGAGETGRLGAKAEDLRGDAPGVEVKRVCGNLDAGLDDSEALTEKMHEFQFTRLSAMLFSVVIT